MKQSREQVSSHGTRGCSSSPRDDQDTAGVLNQEHGALGKCHERLNTPENALQATTVPGDRLGYKGCSAAGRVLGSILSAQPRHCTSLHCAVSCFVMVETAALSVLMCVFGDKGGRLPKVDHIHCLSLSFPLSLFSPTINTLVFPGPSLVCDCKTCNGSIHPKRPLARYSNACQRRSVESEPPDRP